MDLLKTWESALLSSNSIIRTYASETLEHTFLSTPDTLNKVLDSQYADALIPHIKYMH
ncbi:hypothetical protein H9655_09685 [Cytobacillus sp. Sa5YUA1]|uniref:Uncharacterized protein n=1 Tax=Cytobacillus stercorigallinarum TaxID=2762240 RepID=A0ABR8QPE5_9BACI|nr:hypothetical protein [Cytobacillus stercorigallinarum]MBD7937302.1 hypothetical protein [Cytobacillus stercorigallinarum]